MPHESVPSAALGQTAAPGLHDDDDDHRDYYAAIAYSPSTGRYGYAYGRTCLREAELKAIDRCSADDAKVVVWARNQWCALALGDRVGEYGYGYSGTAWRAKARAIEECSRRTTGAHVVVCVFSGAP